MVTPERPIVLWERRKLLVFSSKVLGYLFLVNTVTESPKSQNKSHKQLLNVRLLLCVGVNCWEERQTSFLACLAPNFWRTKPPLLETVELPDELYGLPPFRIICHELVSRYKCGLVSQIKINISSMKSAREHSAVTIICYFERTRCTSHGCYQRWPKEYFQGRIYIEQKMVWKRKRNLKG